tara:strand:- start:351 stop:1298 length:948 start_codon:yes stop_codon:yes gene_type:complete
MPITKTNGGYKWGKSGKTYPTRAGAARQAQAAYASGYKNGGSVPKNYNKAVSIPGSGIAGIPAGTVFPSGPWPTASNTGQAGIAGSVAGSQSTGEAIKNFIAGMAPGQGNTSSAAAEGFRNFHQPGGGLSAASIQNWKTNAALQKMGSGIYNAPGGKGSGKGAGGGRGKMQRMKGKEEKQTKRIMEKIESLTNPQTFMDQGMPEAEAIKMAEENTAKYGTPQDFRKYRYDNNFGTGSVYGTREELRAQGVNALPSLATSWGQYKNWDEEIWPWLQANNMDFANAPDPRIPQEELDKFKQENPLGIRTLPPWWGGG